MSELEVLQLAEAFATAREVERERVADAKGQLMAAIYRSRTLKQPLSVGQVARLAGVPRSTIYRWIAGLPDG